MAQLSLFLDHNGDSEQALRVPRKQRASKSGSGAGEPGNGHHYQSLSLPFDDPVKSQSDSNANGHAQPVPPTVDVVEGVPEAPVSADRPPELIEVCAEAPDRIIFDPRDWQFRPDSGDFIHILTGEVREDDEFLLYEPEEAIEADFQEYPVWEEAVD